MRISKEANAKYAREWRKKNIDKSRAGENLRKSSKWGPECA